MTHAFFKALLFLGAGSVIIAMHHEQDLRKMGGLRKYMPITFVTAWIGSLALAGIPPFAGFFSKDAIIEAVHYSQNPAAGFAYFAVMTGVFITAFYSFRMLFLAFHGKPRMDEHTREHLHESPWVVTVPLVMLAIPSMIAGWMYVEPMLFGRFFGDAIRVAPAHAVLQQVGAGYKDQLGFIVHGMMAPPFWLALAGIFGAWLFYIRRPDLPGKVTARLSAMYTLLQKKYFFDEFNEFVFARGARAIGGFLWRIGDIKIIDGFAVNGTARVIGWFSSVVRHVQSGLIYHYAFGIIVGLFLLMTFFLHR